MNPAEWARAAAAEPDRRASEASEEGSRRLRRGEPPDDRWSPPIARTLGFHFVSAEDGRAVFEMETDPERHANPMGTVHGGVLVDLADAAMGTAWYTGLEEGESFTTVELSIHYFKPVWRARLRAEARVVRRGRTVGLVECDLFDEKGALVARAGSTCMTLRGEQARGR